MKHVTHITILIVTIMIGMSVQNLEETVKVLGGKGMGKEEFERGVEHFAAHGGEMLMSDVRRIAVPREVGSEGLQGVRQHISEVLESSGWHVESDAFQSHTVAGDKSFRSLIAVPTGYGLIWKMLPKVIIACHIDSKSMPELKEPFIGASDSAVPCAILLDVARSLGRPLRQRSDRESKYREQGIDYAIPVLLFFDGEEAFHEWTPKDSIYGARHMAVKWADEGILPSIDVFILLDLIGTVDTQFASLKPNTARVYKQFVDIEAYLRRSGHAQSPKPLFTRRIIEAAIEDDHLPFEARGVPVVHLISVPFPTVWHSEGDNLDAVDESVVAAAATVIRTAVALLTGLRIAVLPADLLVNDEL